MSNWGWCKKKRDVFNRLNQLLDLNIEPKNFPIVLIVEFGLSEGTAKKYVATFLKYKELRLPAGVTLEKLRNLYSQ